MVLEDTIPATRGQKSAMDFPSFKPCMLQYQISKKYTVVQYLNDYYGVIYCFLMDLRQAMNEAS